VPVILRILHKGRLVGRFRLRWSLGRGSFPTGSGFPRLFTAGTWGVGSGGGGLCTTEGCPAGFGFSTLLAAEAGDAASAPFGLFARAGSVAGLDAFACFFAGAGEGDLGLLLFLRGGA